jgi:hypothetical protein
MPLLKGRNGAKGNRYDYPTGKFLSTARMWDAHAETGGQGNPAS